MFHFKAIMATLFLFGGIGTVEARELSGSDASIIQICECVESDEKAQSANCQRLFAEMFPEQRGQHRTPASTAGFYHQNPAVVTQ